MDVSTPLTLIIAAGAGLLSFLSPCVLPLVPGYIGYLSSATVLQPIGGTAVVVNRREAVLHSVAFVLGFAIVFAALGASVGLIGYALVDKLPILQKFGGIILVVFGFHTLGLITIPFLNREIRADMTRAPRQFGYLSSMMVGTIFAAGWTPCIGVVLGGILTMAMSSATAWKGAYLLVIYSLGLGIPFVLTAFGIDRARDLLQRLNKRARLIETISGLLIIGMGLLVFFDVLAWLSGFFYQRFGTFL
jgi:cytochrome c-type biogenesis protein